MRLTIIVFLFALFIFSSCEEEDCIGCGINPKVKMEFEPAFTLDVKDSLYHQVLDEIQFLEDSLALGLPTSQVEAITKELVTLRTDSATLGEDYNLLKSGKIRIDELIAPGAEGFEQFSDSVFWDIAFPVNVQSDTTTFYISYHGFTDTLQLNYERDIIQNIDGLRMRLTNIGVNEEVSTFDSLRVKCNNSACSNDQTTIYIYF